jgi:hypothetical protein
MKRKALHELSLREQGAFLQPIAERVGRENLDKGSYNVYQAGEANNVLVHDYCDHTEQVRVDAATGRTQTVRRVQK